MRKITLVIFVLFGLLLTACGGQIETGITPASDKLTFLFFYTDG